MRKRRVAGMIAGGLALALALFAGVSVAERLGMSETDLSADTGPTVEASLTPVSVASVTEVDGLTGRLLRLEGRAEPGAIVSLQNRGERVLQVRVSEDGVWSAGLPVSGPGMAIEAELFAGDPNSEAGTVSIRGVQTIFRISAQTSPSFPDDAPALVMISAPGAATELVQSPFGSLPAGSALSMGPIDYDDAGGVIFSGRSDVPGNVRLYVANSAIGETRVGADGRWVYIAGSIMPLGEYNVRAELQGADGTNDAVSVLFERLPPMRATATDEATLSVDVSPFRWQIRRSLVGGGLQSTAIFSPDQGL